MTQQPPHAVGHGQVLRPGRVGRGRARVGNAPAVFDSDIHEPGHRGEERVPCGTCPLDDVLQLAAQTLLVPAAQHLVGPDPVLSRRYRNDGIDALAVLRRVDRCATDSGSVVRLHGHERRQEVVVGVQVRRMVRNEEECDGLLHLPVQLDPTADEPLNGQLLPRSGHVASISCRTGTLGSSNGR